MRKPSPMLHLCIAALVALLGLTCGGRPARASSDGGCPTRDYRLVHRAFTGCESSAALGPANDTRDNLLLLLMDAHGLPERPGPDQRRNPSPEGALFSWDEMVSWFHTGPDGAETSYYTNDNSQCQSDQFGGEAFQTAVTTAALPASERTLLLAAREASHSICTTSDSEAKTRASLDKAAERIVSPQGRAFLAYLFGAEAFYRGDYDRAQQAFAAITRTDSLWWRSAAWLFGADIFSYRGYDRARQAVATAIRTDTPWRKRVSGLPGVAALSRGDYGMVRQVFIMTARSVSPWLRAVARLFGVEVFARGEGDGARQVFAAAIRTDSPWLRETSLYMLGRVEVNRMQKGAFDNYGYPQNNWVADPVLVADALQALDAYLRRYPKGDYADSARGLKRRVYWFGGLTDRLVAEYAALMASNPPIRGLDDIGLAEEIDNKLILPDYGYGSEGRIAPATPAVLLALPITDPQLLTVLDLYLMRVPQPDESESSERLKPVIITRAQLEAQRRYFDKRPDLYVFLLATYAFYIDNQPAEVLRLIPAATQQQQFSYVAFSRQVLRGMALAALHDRNEPGFWMTMTPGAKLPFQHSLLELAIAWYEERHGALGQVFASGSPVRNVELREVLLRNVAGPELLRQQASDTAVPPEERSVALYTLLYKEITRGRYADFLKDVALVPVGARTAPPGYARYDAHSGWQKEELWTFTGAGALGSWGCPALYETAARLARNPRNAAARLCLAEFIRTNGFDGGALDEQPDKEELGGSPTLFAGAPYSRMTVYRDILADPGATAADKAYTLYRLIRCYAPGGNNSCGGEEASWDQRGAWFWRMKRDYPSSPWTRKLKFYW